MVRRVEFCGPAVSLSLGFPFGGSGVLWFFSCKAGFQGSGPYLVPRGCGWLVLGSCCDARGSLCIRCCRPEETRFCSSRLRCLCCFLVLSVEGQVGSSSHWSFRCSGTAGQEPSRLSEPCPSPTQRSPSISWTPNCIS